MGEKFRTNPLSALSGKEEVLAHLIVLLADEFPDIFEKKEQVWHFDFSLVDLTFCSKILVCSGVLLNYYLVKEVLS